METSRNIQCGLKKKSHAVRIIFQTDCGLEKTVCKLSQWKKNRLWDETGVKTLQKIATPPNRGEKRARGGKVAQDSHP